MAFRKINLSQVQTGSTAITDPLMSLNSQETGSNSNDLGLILERGSDTNVSFIWDESEDHFALINTTEDGTTDGSITVSGYEDLKLANITATTNITSDTINATSGFIGNLTGNVTGSTTGINYGNVTSTVGTSTFNNVTLNGNLIVNGSTTTVSSTNTTLTDNLIELNTGAGSNDADAGIVIERGTTGDNAFMGWDESSDSFILGTTTATGSSIGNLTITPTALQTGNITATGPTDGVAKLRLSAEEVHGEIEGINIGNNFGGLAFKTNSNGTTAERMRIDSSGNVGIGGSETTVFNGVGGDMKFVVIGDDSTTTIANNSDAGIAIVNTNQTAGNLAGLHFARADTDNTPNYAGASIVAQFPETQVTGQYPKGDLAFLTSTAANNAPSEKMRITAAGNVGIGTSTPASLLEVKASALNRANGIALRGSGANDVLYMYPSADNVATIEHLINGTTNTGGVLAINPQGGNVGIGTASPAKTLDINTASATFRVRNSSGGNDFSFKTTAGPVSVVGCEANTTLALMTNNAERMHISPYGDVGIGRSDPQNIVGNHGGGLVVRSAAGRAGTTGLFAVQSSASYSLLELIHNGSFKLRNDSNAQTLLVDNSGNLTATGDVTAYSDERLKDNIQTIDGALGKVNSMRGVTYTKDGLESSGVIAQEIEKIAPELVKDGEYKSVAYGNLVGYLIEAIKEQQIQIEQSKTEIDNLKKLIGE